MAKTTFMCRCQYKEKCWTNTGQWSLLVIPGIAKIQCYDPWSQKKINFSLLRRSRFKMEISNTSKKDQNSLLSSTPTQEKCSSHIYTSPGVNGCSVSLHSQWWNIGSSGCDSSHPKILVLMGWITISRCHFPLTHMDDSFN